MIENPRYSLLWDIPEVTEIINNNVAHWYPFDIYICCHGLRSPKTVTPIEFYKKPIVLLSSFRIYIHFACTACAAIHTNLLGGVRVSGFPMAVIRHESYTLLRTQLLFAIVSLC